MGFIRKKKKKEGGWGWYICKVGVALNVVGIINVGCWIFFLVFILVGV